MVASYKYIGFMLLFIVAYFDHVNSAKILMFQGFASTSMKFAVAPFLTALAEKNHDVTLITAIPSESETKYNHLAPTKLVEGMAFAEVTDIMGSRIQGGLLWLNLEPYNQIINVCTAFLDSPEVQDIIHGKVKFDLIFIDGLASECALVLPYLSQAPFIYYSTGDLYPWFNDILGLSSNVIYTPFPLPTAGFVDFTQFTSRFVTTVSLRVFNELRRRIVFSQLRTLWMSYLNRELPYFEDIEKNVSLIFVNSHPVVEFPQPYLQSVIEVGGIHIQKPKPLPKNLQEFADNATNGFIIVSFGTVTPSKYFPDEYLDAFIKVFSSINQKIIWKIDIAQNKKPFSENILLQTWLPQNDLLAHSNCKGFITHGGKLSMLEAVYYSIPVIVMPFFADQEIHAHLAQTEGFGILLEIYDVTVSSLSWAVDSIIHNTSYKETITKKSALLRDQQNSPLERGVYWTEWLLRHNKYISHLRPVSSNWSSFIFCLIDVYLAIFLICTSPLLFLYIIIRICSKKTADKGKLEVKENKKSKEKKN